MKKIWIYLFLVSFLAVGLSPLFSQGERENPSQGISQQEQEYYRSYNPRGRRDPFRDLLAGREIKEKAMITGVPQMSINDVTLIGITEAKGKFTAIINGPQGFPYFIKVGQKFVDGFVLKIEESQIVFRKTKERGVPLRKPKDIVKEIKPEER